MPQQHTATLQALQASFAKGHTKTYQWRYRQLQHLKEALLHFEAEIYAALHADLKKNKEEAWVTEIGFVLAEISHAQKNVKRWMKPQKVRTNLLNFPSKSFIQPEPLGVVLIIGPWNYPLQLVLAPLVGALAAGNCVVVKPSEHAPATSAVLQQIIDKAFEKNEVALVQGDGAIVIPQMMEAFRFDHVFYTGSTVVGQKIYEMAAKKLVPVTLELGGKSPCIVEADADIEVAARRIAVTKFSNAGQMCVAPDYLLVHHSVKEPFIDALKKAIHNFYAADEVRDYHFGKVINAQQFARLTQYLTEGDVIYGGLHDAATLFFAPTLITNVAMHSRLMQEEIFGPLLPLIFWSNESEVLRIMEQNKAPLAFYVFTGSAAKAKYWIDAVPFGGGCINNASWHLTNHNLPFGGRGASGIGAYHGRFSFDAFSHKKAILATPTWFDPAVKYPPFKGKLKWFKKLLR